MPTYIRTKSITTTSINLQGIKSNDKEMEKVMKFIAKSEKTKKLEKKLAAMFR